LADSTLSVLGLRLEIIPNLVRDATDSIQGHLHIGHFLSILVSGDVPRLESALISLLLEGESLSLLREGEPATLLSIRCSDESFELLVRLTLQMDDDITCQGEGEQ
ncbi:hypothetical protein PMAYCL1PPCAC_31083, partial [Pristionchus mayeri]